MLRLIGLGVVVLFVLSLAHGERTGGANARAATLADHLTGALADGVRTLGDMVFGPSAQGPDMPDLRALAKNLDGLSRSADGASRRALAAVVMRSCPSLGLTCQPVAPSVTDDVGPVPRRRPQAVEQR